MMKLLIKFPTKMRPEKFVLALEKYITLSEKPENIQYLITLDNDDPQVEKYKIIAQRFPIAHKVYNITFDFGLSGSKIAACNRGMSKTNGWDIVVLASDDMIPQVKEWDTKIAETMENNFPDTDGVLHFNDGKLKDLVATLTIMGRKYYQGLGYLYNPKYDNLWCDLEHTERAIMLDKHIYIDEVIIKHIHPYTVEGTYKDELYQLEGTNEGYLKDKKTWLKERANRYGLGETPNGFKLEYNNV